MGKRDLDECSSYSSYVPYSPPCEQYPNIFPTGGNSNEVRMRYDMAPCPRIYASHSRIATLFLLLRCFLRRHLDLGARFPEVADICSLRSAVCDPITIVYRSTWPTLCWTVGLFIFLSRIIQQCKNGDVGARSMACIVEEPGSARATEAGFPADIGNVYCVGTPASILCSAGKICMLLGCMKARHMIREELLGSFVVNQACSI